MILPQPVLPRRNPDASYGTLSPIIALRCADLLRQFGEAAEMPAWSAWARYLHEYGTNYQSSHLDDDEAPEADWRDQWGDLTPWFVAVLCLGVFLVVLAAIIAR